MIRSIIKYSPDGKSVSKFSIPFWEELYGHFDASLRAVRFDQFGIAYSGSHYAGGSIILEPDEVSALEAEFLALSDDEKVAFILTLDDEHTVKFYQSLCRTNDASKQSQAPKS